MNNKGLMTVEAVFIGLYVSAFVAAAFTQPMHLHKTTIKTCLMEGKTQAYCEVLADSFTAREKMDYVRDDDMSKGNHGIGPGGYF